MIFGREMSLYNLFTNTPGAYLSLELGDTSCGFPRTAEKHQFTLPSIFYFDTPGCFGQL